MWGARRKLKIKNQRLKIWIFTFVIFLCGCAKQPDLRSEAHKKYENGDFEAALKELEEEPHRKQDKLLTLLDKGMFLHAAGLYDESNKIFDEAYSQAEYLESRYAHEEILASLSNETSLPYAGETYERLLIQVFQMLNYCLQGKLEEALVEVRQYQGDLQRFFGSSVPKDFQDSFALSLAGILWEANGLLGDARIDFQKAARVNFRAEAAKNNGNVIVVIESGLSPILVGEKTWVGDILLELPKLEERSSPTDHVLIEASSADTQTFKTVPLTKIAAMAGANLDHKLELAKNHKFVKTALKQWAEAKSYFTLRDKDKNQRGAGELQGLLAAAAFSILFNSMETADTRIWSTLPDSFQIARFELPPGEHKIKIVPKDSSGKNSGRPITQKIRVEKGHPLFLAYRIF